MGLFDSFKKKNADPILKAFQTGKVIPMKEVDDPTFSQEILGPGVAIEPSEGVVYAPCSGTISLVADTLHAVSISADNGAEVLMHIGIDTVELNGEGFESKVSSGQRVNAGDVLITFNLDEIKGKGYKMTTPLIICNKDEFKTIETIASGDVNFGQDLLKVAK